MFKKYIFWICSTYVYLMVPTVALFIDFDVIEILLFIGNITHRQIKKTGAFVRG